MRKEAEDPERRCPNLLRAAGFTPAPGHARGQAQRLGGCVGGSKPSARPPAGADRPLFGSRQEGIEPVPGQVLPVEARFDLAANGPRHLSQQRPIGGQLEQPALGPVDYGAGLGLVAERPQQEAGLAVGHQLGHGADGGGDNRAAARRRFEHRQRGAFGARGTQEDVRPLVPADHVAGGEGPVAMGGRVGAEDDLRPPLEPLDQRQEYLHVALGAVPGVVRIALAAPGNPQRRLLRNRCRAPMVNIHAGREIDGPFVQLSGELQEDRVLGDDARELRQALASLLKVPLGRGGHVGRPPGVGITVVRAPVMVDHGPQPATGGFDPQGAAGPTEPEHRIERSQGTPTPRAPLLTGDRHLELGRGVLLDAPRQPVPCPTVDVVDEQDSFHAGVFRHLWTRFLRWARVNPPTSRAARSIVFSYARVFAAPLA